MLLFLQLHGCCFRYNVGLPTPQYVMTISSFKRAPSGVQARQTRGRSEIDPCQVATKESSN